MLLGVRDWAPLHQNDPDPSKEAVAPRLGWLERLARLWVSVQPPLDRPPQGPEQVLRQYLEAFIAGGVLVPAFIESWRRVSCPRARFTRRKVLAPRVTFLRDRALGRTMSQFPRASLSTLPLVRQVYAISSGLMAIDQISSGEGFSDESWTCSGAILPLRERYREAEWP
jgi:hypothetical protein